MRVKVLVSVVNLLSSPSLEMFSVVCVSVCVCSFRGLVNIGFAVSCRVHTSKNADSLGLCVSLAALFPYPSFNVFIFKRARVKPELLFLGETHTPNYINICHNTNYLNDLVLLFHTVSQSEDSLAQGQI